MRIAAEVPRRSGQPHPDQQAEQALCLTLVVNAIVVWNTVYAQLAIDQLRADGHVITNTDLAGLGLYQHAHLHAYGGLLVRRDNPPGRILPAQAPGDSKT